jgi:hypothetical protein
MSLIEKGFGLTAAGFVRPSLADILEDTHEELEASLGVVLRKDPKAVLGGQIAGSMAKARDQDWGAMQTVHAGFDLRVSTGAALVGLGALHGVAPNPAQPSTGTEILTGDIGTTPLAGDSVTSLDDQLRYQLTEDSAAFALASARGTSEVIAFGAVRSNSGHIYVAMIAGTTGTGAGPSGTNALPVTELDGTVQWAFAGDGLAFASVPIASEEEGPIGGPSGSLTKIGSPRIGWLGCFNPEDVTVGRFEDSDEQLRVRIVAALGGANKATVEAVRSALANREEVTGVIVFENVEHDTDVDGIPGHALEPVITGPTGALVDAAWAQTIFDVVGGGIKTYGTTSVMVADSEGIEHEIRFTRPVEVEVYVKASVVANRKLWPAAGADLAKAAILGYGAAFVAGQDVRHRAVGWSVSSAEIPGTLDVSVQLALVPITTEVPVNIPINLRQIADFDSARTSVVVTFEDP